MAYHSIYQNTPYTQDTTGQVWGQPVYTIPPQQQQQQQSSGNWWSGVLPVAFVGALAFGAYKYWPTIGAMLTDDLRAKIILNNLQDVDGLRRFKIAKTLFDIKDIAENINTDDMKKGGTLDKLKLFGNAVVGDNDAIKAKISEWSPETGKLISLLENSPETVKFLNRFSDEELEKVVGSNPAMCYRIYFDRENAGNSIKRNMRNKVSEFFKSDDTSKSSDTSKPSDTSTSSTQGAVGKLTFNSRKAPVDFGKTVKQHADMQYIPYGQQISKVNV